MIPDLPDIAAPSPLVMKTAPQQAPINRKCTFAVKELVA
jgi:hypothetical protein